MKSRFVAITLVALFSLTGWPAHATVSTWQKAVSIQSRSAIDFDSATFRQSVQDAKDMGANMISLIIPYYQSRVTTIDIKAGWNTPSDAVLANAVDYIHGLGLAVDLKLHLESNDHQWRASINPRDREGWFRNYTGVLKRYAAFAQTHKVEQFTIGTELINMVADTVNPTNTTRWRAIISDLRSRYNGHLTYSANWGENGWYDEKNHIKFWDLLDSIGISAYMPLAPIGTYTDASLQNRWSLWYENDIKPLRDQYQKPVVFTEIGYRSADGALAHPADWTHLGTPDPQEQSDAYQALFAFWNRVDWFGGVNIWDWSSDPNAGGFDDTFFTPQHKPATSVIQKWFTGVSPATVPSLPERVSLPLNISLKDGERVQGTRRFEASLLSIVPSDYRMYWQVDGGQYNQLGDVPNGKEAWIDFGPWKWRGSGPYRITFVAQDKNGEELSRKSLSVWVAH